MLEEIYQMILSPDDESFILGVALFREYLSLDDQNEIRDRLLNLHQFRNNKPIPSSYKPLVIWTEHNHQLLKYSLRTNSDLFYL